MMNFVAIQRTATAGVFVALAVVIGCAPEAQFNLNAVYLVKQQREAKLTLDAARQREVGDVLTAMFGTPDDPQLPSFGALDPEVSKILDVDKLQVSAGPVKSDQSGRGFGLYREHCAHCHGVTGDGAGPTASFLNPYPRDYRLGVFKFTSTPKGMRPTREDLHAILYNGIPGTAMPSFKVLPENEIEAMMHYVRYLSLRGEVERLLINYMATELESERPEDDKPLLRLVDQGAKEEEKTQQTEQLNVLKGFAAEVVQKWIDAESQVVAVPAPRQNRDLAKSIAHGKELFYGSVANCIKCHGDSALGDGQTTDYDDWTKELEPANADALLSYLDAGAMTPRNIRPRNLRLGIYRGGRRPIDLYWRMKNGIHGTPMPGVPMKPDDAGPNVKGLTNDDLWSIIDYVRNLPYESLSDPHKAETSLDRARL